MWAIILSILAAGMLYKLFSWGKKTSDIQLAGLHAVVTGGSSGIGKSVAKLLAQKGANLTLLARDAGKLEETKSEILSLCSDQVTVQCLSIDVGKDYEAVQKTVEKAIETLGPVNLLINCAGTSIPATFEDAKPEDFKRLMDINFFGSVYVTKACIPSMKKKGGHIVFTSSQAGLLGIYGFSAYAASKFALRGLAETLAMELKPFKIFVTLSCPPDTDTPGFAEEEKQKPEITREISKTAGLVPAEVVASGLVADMLKGKFLSTIGFESAIVRIVCAGMSPVTSLSELLIQVHTMGILRLAGFFFLKSFDTIVHKGIMKQQKSEQVEGGQ